MSSQGVLQARGHDFAVATDYEGSRLIECRECYVREVLDGDEDPSEFFDTRLPECHIEWLRKPDGGFRGIALRDTGGFSGRQLIAGDSDGEVTDTVRIYDDDVGALGSMLDRDRWEGPR